MSRADPKRWPTPDDAIASIEKARLFGTEQEFADDIRSNPMSELFLEEGETLNDLIARKIKDRREQQKDLGLDEVGTSKEALGGKAVTPESIRSIRPNATDEQIQAVMNNPKALAEIERLISAGP